MHAFDSWSIDDLVQWLWQYSGRQAGYYPGLRRTRAAAERALAARIDDVTGLGEPLTSVATLVGSWRSWDGPAVPVVARKSPAIPTCGPLSGLRVIGSSAGARLAAF